MGYAAWPQHETPVRCSSRKCDVVRPEGRDELLTTRTVESSEA